MRTAMLKEHISLLHYQFNGRLLPSVFVSFQFSNVCYFIHEVKEMKKYIVLFNPYANNGKGEEKAKKLSEIMTNDLLTYTDMSKIADMESFVNTLESDESIIICGGDGTINRFINSVDTENLKNDVYCYSTGSGNDFLRDIDMADRSEPVLITQYLKNLPTVKVKNKKIKFINNASFGLDGYCCEETDRQRAKKGKSQSYSLIAIKALSGAYKPRNATVIVDGVKHEYKKVWLAPTMNGRYFGGGLMSAPDQNRLNDKHTVSVVIMYGSSRLKSLLVMPSMYKGKHIRRKEMIEVLEGHNISVRYDKPAPVQIDGETIRDVMRCDITAAPHKTK